MRAPADDLILAQDLVLLSALIGSAVGQSSVPHVSIDGDLVSLAIKRHHVGPLLFVAAKSGEPTISSGLLDILENSYQANARGQVMVALLLQLIAKLFGNAGIAWMVLKGLPQAQRLYRDPAWRHSSDVDLLVSPRDYAYAIDILEKNGFNLTSRGLPQNRFIRRSFLPFIRDVTLTAPFKVPCHIELHQKPLFISGRLAESFRASSSAGDDSIPAPAVDADLAFYLISHGALCFWARLKWLVDLVPLFAKLDDTAKTQLVERSLAAHTPASLAASLLLLQMLFPAVSFGPVQPWLDRNRRDKKVQNRLGRYIRTLNRRHLAKSSPVNSRIATFHANWLYYEDWPARAKLLALGPVSSAVRFAMTALAQR